MPAKFTHPPRIALDQNRKRSKHRPKTLDDLIAAYADLVEEVKRVRAAYYHLSLTSPPIGSIALFAGEWPPKRADGPDWTEAELGWLPCKGQTLNSRNNPEYKQLARVLGTTYGPVKKTHEDPAKKTKEDPDDFKLPDLCGRGPIGAGASLARDKVLSGPTLRVRTLGERGGEEDHTLAVNELPSHDHKVNDPGHVHLLHWGANIAPGTSSYERSTQDGQNPESETPHTRSATTGITITNTGGNAPHNNMQPFLALYYVIKFR